MCTHHTCATEDWEILIFRKDFLEQVILDMSLEKGEVGQTMNAEDGEREFQAEVQ